MNKFSIIIPTLWRSYRISKLLNELISCHSVDEIILIDNTGIDKKINHPKIKYCPQTENLFVSKSWNLGINLANNERICILNDDINFDASIFNVFPKFEGFVGQCSKNYFYKEKDPPIIEIMNSSRPWGWGCMIFTEKKYWIKIPDELKVWYNDDFIVQINPYPKYILKNFKIETEMSSTVNHSEFNETKKIDYFNWQRILQQKILN